MKDAIYLVLNARQYLLIAPEEEYEAIVSSSPESTGILASLFQSIAYFFSSNHEVVDPLTSVEGFLNQALQFDKIFA
jgi:hypothetical protein